jgi:PhzF family phenazine biosynthesis protein
MSLAHVIVDAFTDTPLQQNQLAVFEDRPALSDDQMQRLAPEMNMSETVFLLPAEARSPQGTGHRSRCYTILLPSGRAAHRSEPDYLWAEGCSRT